MSKDRNKRRNRRAAKWDNPETLFNENQKCDCCDTPLGVPGGYGNSGLCGPCCTGEAKTLREFGVTW